MPRTLPWPPSALNGLDGWHETDVEVGRDRVAVSGVELAWLGHSFVRPRRPTSGMPPVDRPNQGSPVPMKHHPALVCRQHHQPIVDNYRWALISQGHEEMMLSAHNFFA